jgi:SWI/SNF related-matrix-associated actin-dependent regulator of chromatin subfamily C
LEPPAKKTKVNEKDMEEDVQMLDSEEAPQEPEKVPVDVPVVSVPSYANWFNADAVHEVEIRALGPSITTSESYKVQRNQMVEMYRAKPDRYLSLSYVRRFLRGDAVLLARIHSLLEKWGLINYAVDAARVPIFAQPKSSATVVVRDDVVSVGKGQSVLGGAVNVVSAGLAVAGLSSDEPEWTASETLSLLASIERHGENWTRIAQEVGRPKEDCVAHFLRLPIEDPYIALSHQSAGPTSVTKENGEKYVYQIVACLHIIFRFFSQSAYILHDFLIFVGLVSREESRTCLHLSAIL